ncbi:hypothetical protein [Bradyrhizobium sp. RDM4]|uniref:hypothetical protein n=1 Tax=Bradyrhizobium sp. RDM4 TaxID=3378765 RepID=UPI0038FD12BC
MPVRRSPEESPTFQYRLARDAINLRQQAKGMPLGIRRAELLQKARQIDAAILTSSKKDNSDAGLFPIVVA